MNLPAAIQAQLLRPDIPAFAPQFPWSAAFSHVILIILDGVGQTLWNQNDWPNIKRLRDGGSCFSRCLTSTPTITGSCHTSIHSGCYPETHHYRGPVALKEGFPEAAVNGRLGFKGFISDALKARGMSSAAISDGTLKTAFFSLYAEGFSGHSIAAVAREARRAFSSYRPHYLTMTFYAVDTLSHRYGPNHEYVHLAMAEIDQEIGALLDFVDTLGLASKTAFVLAADHGFVETTTSINGLLVPDLAEVECFAPNLRCLLTSVYPQMLGRRLGNERVDRILGPAELKALGYEHDSNSYLLCLKGGFTWQYQHPYRGNHGGFSEKERNVPLLFFGPGIEAKTFSEPVEVIDIAPTIGALLGAEYLDSQQGRRLREIVGQPLSAAEQQLTKWRQQREQGLQQRADSSRFRQLGVERLQIEEALQNEYRWEDQ